jgi:hypothetical protein
VPPARAPIPIVGDEVGRQRLGTEAAQQRVRERVAGDEVHAAETPRVIEAHAPPPRQHEVDMVMGLRRLGGVDQAQAPRHAEVDDQRATVGADEQVLGAPRDALHPAALEGRLEARRQPPAQAPVAHHDRGDALALEHRRKAAAGGLDLGELRHAPASALRNTMHRACAASQK